VNQMKWYERLFTRIGISSEQKHFERIEEKPTEIKHGASYISNGGRSAYSQLGSLGAYVQHPYVYAALSRISQDLAMTPLKLISGKGQNSKIIDDHPAIDLLEEPSTGVDQFSFLEQLTIDLVAAGNAYILILGESDVPVSIVRLHPEQVGIVTNEHGIIAYRFDSDGAISTYPPDRIVHIRNATWATGLQGLYGVGAVQPTQQEIKADLNVSGLVEVASKKGRPDVILSPKNELDIWQEETRRDVLERYNGMVKEGGAIVLSGQVQVDMAQTTPRDVEFKSVKEFSKLAITAAFGTPLSVLGEGSANYATARQEAVIHWSNVEKRGKKIAWALTKIARRFDPSLRFEFDYSEVEAVNSMRTEQITRATSHIMNGMEAGSAYSYEGMHDAPIGTNQDTSEPEPETPTIEDEEQVTSLASWLIKSTDDEITEDLEDLCIHDLVKKGSVGDVDPTNFPVDGEDQSVSLNNSQWETFDPAYAQDLKENHPRIWKAGGNIEGNNQYRRLYPIATRTSKIAKTDTEEMAIRKREAWNARHFEDGSQHSDPELSPNLSNVAGIVAQIKWLAVGSLGEKKMKSVLNELKAKLEEQKTQRRGERWDYWVKAKQEPAQRMFEKATKRYLQEASQRYARRIRRYVRTKSIIDLGELEAIAEEKRLIFNSIGGVFQRVWNLNGTAELDAIFRLAKMPRPMDLMFGGNDIMEELITSLSMEISRTTANAVTKSIQDGLINGQSVNQIASNIDQIAAFGAGRAMMIARTESTRAVNRSAVEAYRQGSQETGLTVMKEWISARDGNTRETHLDLDGQIIGVDDAWETMNGSTMYPSGFGDPAEDINCRCTVAPVVK